MVQGSDGGEIRVLGMDPVRDRAALHAAQEANDTMMAFQALRRAYNTDVAPILAMARMEAGGAIDALEAYRLSQYRSRKAQERKAVGLGTGIV